MLQLVSAIHSSFGLFELLLSHRTLLGQGLAALPLLHQGVLILVSLHVDLSQNLAPEPKEDLHGTKSAAEAPLGLAAGRQLSFASGQHGLSCDAWESALHALQLQLQQLILLCESLKSRESGTSVLRQLTYKLKETKRH